VTVVVSGREVRFAVAAHTGGGTFRATLRGDGQAMSGDFTQAQGGVVVPFRLTRTGAARIAPPL
jgi:hypothetical protein